MMDRHFATRAIYSRAEVYIVHLTKHFGYLCMEQADDLTTVKKA
jgi:hypothetical protein